MKKLPAKRPKPGRRGEGREAEEVYRQVPTPAPRPVATPVAVCAYAEHTGNFIIHWHAHMKPRISP